MTPARAGRVFGAMLRVSFAESVAYRAESVIWLLSTTMPLVMMSLFVATAGEGRVGRYDGAGFVAYFLWAFLVRTTTGSWAAWQMNMDIRDGTLAVRLLRPAPPLLGYAADNLAAIPLRAALCAPVAVVLIATTARASLPRDPVIWVSVLVAMLGAWLLNLVTNLAIGCLAFFAESSVKVMDLYVATFFVLSGYTVPLDVFPPGAARALAYLPFHFQLGFPVELATGAYDRAGALRMLAILAVEVVAAFALLAWLWRRGLSRFAAYGG